MLKYGFILIVVVHALIHVMGFAKAFGYGNITQLTKDISKPVGLAWFGTSLLFIAAVVLFLLKKESWPVIAIAAAIVSQALIIGWWKDAKWGTIVNAIVLIASIIGYQTTAYYNKYQADVKKEFLEKTESSNALLTEPDIMHLPDPVKNYLRYTRSIGKPRVNNFKVTFTGKLRKNEASEWMSFSSEQYNFMERPTRLFFMNAVMKKLPVAGYHRYHNGNASMDIRLLSLFRVQYQAGAEMDTAETVTFFNDMCCMAPATLIDKRINWLEVTGNKVKASFTNNNITITSWLHFSDSGELINFISNDRYATDAGKKLPWATPLKNYKEINGFRLPGYADAIYSYPNGDLVYGTFTNTGVEYNCHTDE